VRRRTGRDASQAKTRIFVVLMSEPEIKKVQRKIIHIDMDAFYASVEQRDHPEYNGIS
jgi:hypothetical protein